MTALPSHIIEMMAQSLRDQLEADARQRADLVKWIESIDERAEDFRRQLAELGEEVDG